MKKASARDKILKAFNEQGLSKAELSRRSGVPYHAIDKYLKRENATTSSENAAAMAKALGINLGDDRDYEELRALFYQLSEEQQRFVLASVRGLLS